MTMYQFGTCRRCLFFLASSIAQSPDLTCQGATNRSGVGVGQGRANVFERPTRFMKKGSTREIAISLPTLAGYDIYLPASRQVEGRHFYVRRIKLVPHNVYQLRT